MLLCDECGRSFVQVPKGYCGAIGTWCSECWESFDKESEEEAQIVDAIHDLLTMQAFADFYEGPFMDYIEGDYPNELKEQKKIIRHKIKNLLKRHIQFD